MPAKVHRSNLLKKARQMPPLYHTIPHQEFDINKSEVIKWLLMQPEMLNYIWNSVKNSGAVTYNPNTGKWQGVDNET